MFNGVINFMANLKPCYALLPAVDDYQNGIQISWRNMTATQERIREEILSLFQYKGAELINKLAEKKEEGSFRILVGNIDGAHVAGRNSSLSNQPNPTATTVENTSEKRPVVDFSKLDSVNIAFRRPVKWYMYVVKRVLKEHPTTVIRARPSAAAQSIRVAEALKKLGYLEITNYSTTTVSDTRGLDRFLCINVARTKDFNNLFDAREEERKKFLESHEKKN